MPRTQGSDPIAGRQVVVEARQAAARMHGDQRYGQLPYSVHLDDVARTTCELGLDDSEAATVAYLHDVLEDTQAQPAELEASFGPAVRRAVEDLTYRGQPFSAYLDSMGDLALAVKIADRISNVRALAATGLDRTAQRGLLGKYERQVVAFVLCCERRGGAFNKALDVLKTEIRDASARIRSEAVSAAGSTEARMELPVYCIVGRRPVKAVATKEGGMDVLAYDWGTGRFVRDMTYLRRVVFPDGEVDVVGSEEFERYVAELKASRP